MICQVALTLTVAILGCVSHSEAALKRFKPRHILVAAPVLPAPLTLPTPTIEPLQSLFYREAKEPIGDHNAVAFWMKGDSRPGTVSIYLLASGGESENPFPIAGTGKDEEPLWPAWISSPISTDFAGWHEILIKASDMNYRAPVNVSSADQPADPSSADTFGIASANDSGTLYLNDIVWANVDSAGNAVGDSSIIEDFSSGDIASWKLKGPKEAVVRLRPSITSLLDYVKVDPISLKLDYGISSANRAILAENAERTLSITGNDYLVSIPSSPFERIWPDSLPSVTELSSRLQLRECPEQTTCGSFVVYSEHGLTDVSVHLASNLNGFGQFIPRSSVNISVVKVWDRQGDGVLRDPDSIGPTPELLVKDDRIDLSHAGGLPPVIRLTGAPITNIPAGTEKQFWVDVTVPRNTPAGKYSTQLIVKSTEDAPFSLTLEVDVLPLRLLSPAKQYSINFRGKLGPSATVDTLPGDLVTLNQLSSELADLSSHGFHYISLSDAPGGLPQTLAAEAPFDFQTPILYPIHAGPSGLATAEAVDKLGGSVSPFCYLVPNSSSLADDLAALKNEGLQTAAIIKDEREFNLVQNNLDIAIYPLDDPYVQRLLRTGGERKYSTRDWLTWPAGQTDPQIDRLCSGFLLWRSDLYGAYVSDYQTSYTANPFDDTSVPSDPQYAALRPAMLTYPAQGGVVDTVQWEAMREGINDVRYLTTFYAALRECKDAKVDLLTVAKAETDVTAFLNQNFWLMSDSDYQKGRAMISIYAVQLRAAVDNYNAHLTGASQ